MRLIGTLSATVLAAVLVVGCTDSTDSGHVSEDDLVGVWNATQFLLTSTANSAVTIERISQDGWFTLTINADGTWSEEGVFPGNPPKTECRGRRGRGRDVLLRGPAHRRISLGPSRLG